MSEKIKCSRCKNKLPKLVCGCRESPHYHQSMNSGDYCDFFVINPAQDHLTKGLVASFTMADSDNPVQHEQKAKASIAEFEKAIEVGLPEDDAMCARYLLGEAYYSLLQHKSDEYKPRSKELATALREMEQAVEIDAKGGYGYFAEPLNASRLVSLAIAYIMTSKTLAAESDVASRVQYLEGKLYHFDHLLSPPLLLLLHIAELYASQGDNQRASEYNKRILHAPINPASQSDIDVRQAAEQQLKKTERRSRQQLLSRSGMKEIACPLCGSKTVVRTAKKGPDAGKEFYVCNRYPDCKGKILKK